MLIAQLPHASVFALRECLPPGLAQPGDHRNRWFGQTALAQLLVGPVLEQAEESELLAAWASPSARLGKRPSGQNGAI
jgi:hypothetical protein